MFCDFHREQVPKPVEIIVPGYAGKRFTGIIGTQHLGKQVYFPATCMYAFVEFDVLVAHQKGVVQTKAGKDVPAKTPERHGVGLHDVVIAGVNAESGVPHSEFVAENLFYGIGFGRVVQHVGTPPGTHVVSLEGLQRRGQG